MLRHNKSPRIPELQKSQIFNDRHNYQQHTDQADNQLIEHDVTMNNMSEFMCQNTLQLLIIHCVKQSLSNSDESTVFIQTGGKSIGNRRLENINLRYFLQSGGDTQSLCKMQ